MKFDEGMGGKKIEGKLFYNGKEMQEGVKEIDIEWRMKQEPNTFTDEQVRGERVKRQLENQFVDDADEGGWE